MRKQTMAEGLRQLRQLRLLRTFLAFVAFITDFRECAVCVALSGNSALERRSSTVRMSRDKAGK